MNFPLIFLIVFSFSIVSLNPSFAKIENNKRKKSSCSNKIVKNLKSLILADDKNILKIQYQVTILKLLKEMKSSKHSNIESLLRDKEHTLKSSNSKVLKNLKEQYLKYGEKNDLESIQEKIKTASYWNKKIRFYDADLSQFVLAKSIIEKKSNFNLADASILWFHSTIERKARDIFGENTSRHNMLNTSTILYKLNQSNLDTDKKLGFTLSKLSNLKNKYFQKLSKNLKKWCPRLPLKQMSLASCQIINNEFNKAFIKTINELKDDVDLGIYKFQLKGDIKDKLGRLTTFKVIAIKQNKYKKLTQKSKKIKRKRGLSSLSDKNRLEDTINNFLDIDKIKAYQKIWGKEKTFAVIDKKRKILQVFSKDGELLKVVPIIIKTGDNRADSWLKKKDGVREGGSGIYLMSHAKNKKYYLKDQRNRPSSIEIDKEKISIDCSIGFCRETTDNNIDVTKVYILPEDKDNHFLIKNSKVHFTSFKKRKNYYLYNYSPKDKKYVASFSQVNDPTFLTDKTRDFLQALDDEKETIMRLYGLDNHEYNMLIKYSFGIFGVESKLGESNRLLKEKVQFLIPLAKLIMRGKYETQSSRGLTQIKNIPKIIKKHYGINKDDLMDSKKAAIATIGFLAQSLKELKAIEKKHPAITPINRFDYLHYIYQGKRNEIIKGTATPEVNIYFKGKRSKTIGSGRNKRKSEATLGISGYMELVDIYEKK